MGTITGEMIEAAYAVAKKVFNNEIALDEGVKILHGQYEMNSASAQNLIRNYSCLIQGDEYYKRAMSGAATRYFLQNILDDFGADALRQALKVVDLHIKYYESFKRGKLNNIRKIYDEFLKKYPISAP